MTQDELPDLGSIDATVDRWMKADAPPRRWLVERVIPLGNVAVILAPGGSGKSLLSLQLAMAVSTGTPWLGSLAVAEPGGVLALYAEEDADELHRRIFRINKIFGPYRHRHGGKYILSRTGKISHLTKRTLSGEVFYTKFFDELMNKAQNIVNLRLIILDPVSRFQGGDENSSHDITCFVAALELLSKTTGATVICLHHVSKNSLVNNSADSQTASRGSSALIDGARLAINLVALSPKDYNAFGIRQDCGKTYLKIILSKANYLKSVSFIIERDEYGVMHMLHSDKDARVNTDLDTVLNDLINFINKLPEKYSVRQLEELCIHQKLNCTRENIRNAIELGIHAGALQVVKIPGPGRKTVLVPGDHLPGITLLPPSSPGACPGRPGPFQADQSGTHGADSAGDPPAADAN